MQGCSRDLVRLRAVISNPNREELLPQLPTTIRHFQLAMMSRPIPISLSCNWRRIRRLYLSLIRLRRGWLIWREINLYRMRSWLEMHAWSRHLCRQRISMTINWLMLFQEWRLSRSSPSKINLNCSHKVVQEQFSNQLHSLRVTRVVRDSHLLDRVRDYLLRNSHQTLKL
jgi:hypothetical protein